MNVMPTKNRTEEERIIIVQILGEKEVKFRRKVRETCPDQPEARIEAFCDYWCQPNRSMTKLFFETKPVFSIRHRMAAWARNEESYKEQQEKPAKAAKPKRDLKEEILKSMEGDGK